MSTSKAIFKKKNFSRNTPISDRWTGREGRKRRDMDTASFNYVVKYAVKQYMKLPGITITGCSVKAEKKKSSIPKLARGAKMNHLDFRVQVGGHGTYEFAYDWQKTSRINALCGAVCESLAPYMTEFDEVTLLFAGITCDAPQGLGIELSFKERGSRPVHHHTSVNAVRAPMKKLSIPLPM